MSNVKAGKYELVALFWEEPISKVGEPYDYVRHNRGDIVTLNVEEARRLVQAGAVVEPGSRERAQAEALRAQYEAALAQLPDAARQEPDEAPAGEGGAVVLKPQQTAPKGQWVAYAVSNGMDEAEAEAMGKQDLIAALS